MHDWTRVDGGTFHHFHSTWVVALADALNGGVLPPGYYAMIERHADRGKPDLIARREPPPEPGYAGIRRTVAVRHVSEDEVVALIEIASPGNKGSRHAVRAFVEQVAGAVETGVHVLLVDPFPPGPRDPDGLHPLVWADFRPDERFALPADARLTAAAYAAGPVPDLPLFLAPDGYVPCPSGASYTTAFAGLPPRLRALVTS